MTITMTVAVANTAERVSSDELEGFLSSKTQDVEYFRQYPAPGQVIASAFDWHAVIGSTASVIAIGHALWMAYCKFVKPDRDKGKENAYLIVQIKNEQREFEQLAIGELQNSEEEFIKEFSAKFERIRSTHTEIVVSKKNL